MLCCGPPQMHNLLLDEASQPGAGLLAPCTVSALGLVGLRTRSGMGAAANSIPQVEKARTSLLVLPLSRPAKKVWTWSTMSTRMKGFAVPESAALGIGTPGGAPLAAVVGKLTLTRLP